METKKGTLARSVQNFHRLINKKYFFIRTKTNDIRKRYYHWSGNQARFPDGIELLNL